MNNQLKMRVFSILSILSMLLAAVVTPTSVARAASPDTISGNAGVGGATITWNGTNMGSSDGSTTADANGNYSFQVTYWFRWEGTVTPSKTGYSFSPSSRSYNMTSDQTNQNYTATLANYTISGSVGSAGGGATITWDGSGSNPDGSTTANSSGSYSFTVPGGWSGTVTPSKTGYTFSPGSRSYTSVSSNQTNQNYTATLVTYTISGNAGVGNATITYTGGSTTANSSGNYSFTVSLGWSGTVTPSRTGYSFVPPNRSYTNVTANQSAQDYTARPTSFTFGSMADGQAQSTYFSPTADQLASLNPALVLYVGDLEENGFLTSEANAMVNVLKSEGLFNKTFMVRGNGDNHVANSAGLWESYLETSPNIPSRPAFVVNKVALNSSSDNLTYSFDYGNSIFIGVDAPGDIDYLEQNELDFINARLTYAEGAGLTHAFLFFHGPAYPVESVHSICQVRTDATCTPPALMTIINNHPIVSATFHGHEHVLAWTHMDATRVDTLTRSYEQFVTSPAGGSSYHEYLYPARVDYAYTDMENSMGFATVAVNGLEFTVRFYKTGTSQPVWTHTFSKVNTPPTISNITDKTTAEDTATATIPFTVGDVETNTDYLTVTATSSDTTLVPDDHIALNGSGANRTLNITPALNQSGTATITVSVNDGNVTVQDTFVLTVNAVNDAPVADPQSLSMLWNTSLNIVLTGSDVENSPLTFDIVDDPEHGTLTGSGVNRTYTPAAGYSGPDSFTFKVNDANLDSAPATVSLLVTAHTISGNAGVAGATLRYMEGATPRTITADGTGAYSFQVPAGWSGTVTPSKAGYYFAPASMTYTDVQADHPDQNYSVSVVMIVISGNAGVAGATLSYNDGTPKTVTSDESGLYSFEVPYNWSGMVTPSKTGYGFRPGTRTYTNVIEDRYAEDYTTTTARVWYVDKTNPACTDTGQVGSFAQPFCTITRGAYLAQPGQIVHVLHGTYAETVYPERSGTSGSPISYWGDPGVVVTGQPGTASVNYAAFALGARNYIVIDGFRIDNTSYKGIYVDGSHHVTITNNHVSRAGNSSLYHPYEQGIYTRNTSNSTISGNITDHNTCIGIRVVGGDHNLISNNTSFSNYSVVETDAAGIELTGSSYNTVINNLTYSNEDTGINVYLWDTTVDVQSTYNLVINNLSYENGDHGIDVNNSPYNTFIGNTVHGNGTVGINIEGEATTGSHHSTLFNNISVGNGFTPPAGSFGGNMRVDTPSVPGTVLDYNLYNKESAVVDIVWDNTNYASLAAFKAAVPTQEVHSLEADPLFVDPVPPALRETGVPYVGAGILGNYYPKFGSPAIDSANSNAPSQQPADIDGNSRLDDPGTPNTGAGVRTYDDRGAYEYLPSGPSLPVVTTQAVTNISQTTATCNGTIAATGLPNPTQHGCVWATHSIPTTDDNKTSNGPVSATGAFTSSLTGLTPGTLYYVRAYATNSEGTVYGAEVIFTAHLLPTVLTQAVTNIGTTTATGNGDITSLGVPNPTQHGMVWSTSPNPTIADSKTEKGTASAIGAFTSNLTGLTPGTLYYIRAYVTNAAGTVYGNDFTFTTHVEPTVTTQAVTNITQATATGNGNITSLGVPNPIQHGVVWGTSPNPTTANNKTTNGPVSATGAFTSNLTGLIPGTLYYVRAYATNETGTVYGGEVTFTAQQLPTVTTQAATNITTTTATGNGNITGLGVPNPTEHGVVWSTVANPTITDNKTTDGAVSATGTFISSITGLTPGTLYHVRAYATNAAGTVYGNDVSFTTDILPTVTTQAVTNITQTTATGHGNVTALGVPNPTEHGVVWSTVSNPTTADSKTTDGPVNATGAFNSSILGLTPGTLYYVRAYATNEVGTVYGQEVTFTTLLLPAVTTQDVTAITINTATGNGNVTALGIPNPTQHGFVWSTSPNPTTAGSKTTNGPVSATGAFTGNFTGLAECTLYHVRAYITNAAGTVYGEDVTFTTLCRAGVTTQAVTDITQTTATGHGTITSLGSSNPTEHGLVWSTLPNPTTADNKTTEGPVSATGAFTSSITGLTPGTLYYVRAYAISAAGTSYDPEVVTFTTLLLPTVTTQEVTNITENTATGNGTINVLGIPNPTQHGVVWSTSPNPTTADSKTTDGPVSVTGAFTSNMTGLVIGTQYYVRAYATNAAGTVYGNEVTFTTTSSSSGTTTPATNAGSGNDVSGTGTAVWQNPGFITADDNTNAQVNVSNSTSHYLYGTDYGFAIPANAIVNGIQVTIGRYESGQQAGNDVRDNVVRLLKSGVTVGNNKAAAGTEWPTAEANAVYGSNSDLWGAAWTAADINASDFGVALSVNSANNRIAYVDFMQVSVTYTVTRVGSITTVNCGAGTPVAVYGSSITCVATVTRGSGTFTPTGDVSWTTNGSGSFSPTSCSVAGTNGVATCSVSYTPNAVGSGSHLITANYAGDLSFYASTGNQTVTVNPKPITITPIAGQTKVYGDADPLPFTYTRTALVGTDAMNGTLGRVSGENVGTYAYTLGSLDAGPNYILSMDPAPATFSITPKSVTITPDAGQTKVFGASDPLPFTYTHAALLGTDTISGTLGRVAGEDVGTYAYTLGSLTAGTNYVLSIVTEPATFSITPKPVTITPDAGQTKVFGDADPTFTYTSSDPAAIFTGALGRVTGEDVGMYAYTLGTLSAATNYTLSIAADPATFSITPKTVTVTADAGQTKVFGAADPIFTYTSSDPVATFTGVLDREVGETVGTYVIGQGTLTAGSNYSITFVSSLFTITPPTEDYTLTLTPDEHGTIVADPNNTVYHWGDVVQLTATGNYGWAFANWTGGLTGSDNPASLTIHGNTTVTANYTAVSVPPLFTSTPVTGVNEDAPYTYNITASDPNIGDILAISAVTKPAWLGFTDNGNGAALLTGTPTNSDVGSHEVVLRVSDGALTTDQTFSILVTNINDAPSFTSEEVTSATEDVVYTYEITTTDPDAVHTLVITAPVMPDWLTLTDHGDGTATLTGTPTNEDVDVHDVTLRVSDGSAQVDQIFTIDVGNTNDGPSFTSNPVISVDEDTLYTYEITTTDPDLDDVLTISATTTLPAWLTLTDHGDGTATLSGTPANGNVGSQPVTLQVSDGIEMASQPFTITVANINDAPVLTQPLDQTNEQGDVVSLQLSATDVDLGDTLTYSASGLPEGLNLDTETGLITGTITGAIDTYSVTAGVDDGNGGTDSKTLSWSVTPPTYTLTINIIGNGTVTKDPDQTSYLNGAQVALTPVPATGWRLDHWSENVVDGKVTISGDITVTVTFVQIEYTLTVNTVGSGHVTRDNPGPYHYGDVVTLTAVADAGWAFSSWEGCTGTGATCTVTWDGNKTVTATFILYVPSGVLLGQPSDTLTSWDHVFYWTGVSGGTWYELDVQDAGGNTLFSQWYTADNVCTATNCSVTPMETMGLSNGDYTWRIRDYGPYGYGSWTAFQSFTLDVSAAGAILGQPSDTLTSWDKSFEWTGLVNATWYELQVQTSDSTIVYDQWYANYEVGCQGSTACTVTILDNLPNGDYQWRIKDYGAYGYGSWTAFKSFTLNLSATGVVLGDPVDTLTSWDKSFEWTGLSNATWYELQVQTSDSTIVYDQWYANYEVGCQGSTACTVTILDNLPNGDYQWRIKDYGAYGYGSWTAFKSFTLNLSATGVVLGDPVDTLTSWDKSFEWTGLSNATWYELEVRKTDGTIVYDEWYTRLQAGCNTGSACIVTILPDLPNGDYQWRIQDYGPYGYGSWTAFQSFTLDVSAAGAILGQPSDTLTSWDHVFYWTGVSGGTWYELDVQDAGGNTLFSQWYTADNVCTATNCSVTPMETMGLSNGDYTWRIRDYGPYGYGSWTTFQPFTLNLP